MILEPNNIHVLFADDVSVLISHANPKHFNAVYRTLDDWFKNLLSLNTGKTQYINFTTKNNRLTERDMEDISSLITSSNHSKFLGLTIDSTLT